MPRAPSLLSSLALLDERSRQQAISRLTEAQVRALVSAAWQTDLARPNQLAPEGDWRTWLLLAGRGFGKTRTGAEWVRDQARTHGRIALIAPTAGDARDVMVEGESGILAISPNWDRPEYEPSKRRITWANGATATTYSADEPDRLRGPQHDAAWADEVAAWRYPDAAWDNLQMGLRLGRDPRAVVTTTPRPTALIRALVADTSTVITRGSTFDNSANLAASTLAHLRRKYEGSRLGRQELYAEILDDAPGALWKRGQIDSLRVTATPADLVRIVVAVDPAATSGEAADETGIIVAALGGNGHGYVLADRTLRGTPLEWATAAVRAYSEFSADRIVAEVNQGGEMVTHVLRTVDRNVPISTVHAARSKHTRAEPVAALYEQGRIHHVGAFPQLEDQLCAWTPGESSPDRLDALVWAFTELMVDGAEELHYA